MWMGTLLLEKHSAFFHKASGEWLPESLRSICNIKFITVSLKQFTLTFLVPQCCSTLQDVPKTHKSSRTLPTTPYSNISILLCGITPWLWHSFLPDVIQFLFPVKQEGMGPRLPLSQRGDPWDVDRDWQQVFFSHTGTCFQALKRCWGQPAKMQLCRTQHLCEPRWGKTYTGMRVQRDIPNPAVREMGPYSKNQLLPRMRWEPRGEQVDGGGPKAGASERMGILP